MNTRELFYTGDLIGFNHGEPHRPANIENLVDKSIAKDEKLDLQISENGYITKPKGANYAIANANTDNCYIFNVESI
jgi:hypothetical protein